MKMLLQSKFDSFASSNGPKPKTILGYASGIMLKLSGH